MISSPLAIFNNDLGVAASVLLFACIAGFAGALIQRFGGPFARTLRGLFHSGSSPARLMRVLVVEDNPDSRETLKRYLTARAYDVAAAGDLRTGIDLLNKQRFDAIIADIALPDGTGYTLINEARHRGMRALGIALSGYPYPSNVQEPGVTGFDYHLTKPVDCDDLCSLLEKARDSGGS